MRRVFGSILEPATRRRSRRYGVIVRFTQVLVCSKTQEKNVGELANLNIFFLHYLPIWLDAIFIYSSRFLTCETSTWGRSCRHLIYEGHIMIGNFRLNDSLTLKGFCQRAQEPLLCIIFANVSMPTGKIKIANRVNIPAMAVKDHHRECLF